MSSTKSKLVLVGWHGADWRSIHPLVDAGWMPNLRALIERGVTSNLRASGPPVPAIIWNSIATGKTADQHGVLSGIEPDPFSGGTRPAGNTSRRAKALWNITMQSGLVTHLIGWLGSHPAEKLNGCCVAPDFVRPLARYGAPWPILPGSIWPERLRQEIADCRIHPGELRAEDLRPFIPRLSEIDQEADRRVVAFADMLAQTISTHAIATWLLEHEPWDTIMIGWSGLQRACHAFIRYAAPQLASVHPDDCARYGEVVRGMYCYHDMLLGRVIQLAGPEATIAVISPAGFRTGPERPVSAALQRVPVAWYRPYGIFCMAGPEIVRDELVHNVNVYDIAPTTLSVLGLPPGRDMPGRVVSEAFLSAQPEHRIASWEEIPGECGMGAHTTGQHETTVSAVVDELAALGYADPAADASAAAVARERSFNTALVHLSRQDFAAAREALLAGENMDRDVNSRLLLAYCHFRCGDPVQCLTALAGIPKEGVAGAQAKILESFVAASEGNTRQAISAAMAAERMGPDHPVVNFLAGSIYAHHGQLARAEDALRSAIAADSSFQPAHALLAQVLRLCGKTAEAAQAALAGLSVDYASACLHSALGAALAERGDMAGAQKAFDTSLAFEAHHAEAAEWKKKFARVLPRTA